MAQSLAALFHVVLEVARVARLHPLDAPLPKSMSVTMTWRDFAIQSYSAKTKDRVANENRRQAQRLLILESKRSNPKLNSQVNHNKILLTKKRK
jgi:hypothetical protein